MSKRPGQPYEKDPINQFLEILIAGIIKYSLSKHEKDQDFNEFQLKRSFPQHP
jgi:hypothetical protein